MYCSNSIPATAYNNVNPGQGGFNHFINVATFCDCYMFSEIFRKVLMGR